MFHFLGTFSSLILNAVAIHPSKDGLESCMLVFHFHRDNNVLLQARTLRPIRKA